MTDKQLAKKELRKNVNEQIERLESFKVVKLKKLSRILGLPLSHAIKGNPHARLKKGELIAAIKKEIARNYDFLAVGANSRLAHFVSQAESVFS